MLPAATMGAKGTPSERAGQRIQCHEKSAFNTQLWKRVLWWSKEWFKIRHLSALRRAGLTGFGIQRSFPNPLTVYLSLRGTQCSGLSTHASTLPEPTQAGRNPQRRKFARGLQPDIRPRLAEPSTARRSAQPTGPIWGCRALGNPGNKRSRLPAPERPTPPGGEGCGDWSLSGGSCRPSGPHSHSRPKFDRGHEKARKTLRLALYGCSFRSDRGTTEGKRFPTLNKSAPTGGGKEQEGAKRGRSPSLPKGSRFLSPSIRLNLGLSRRSRFQWPVASSSRDTSA